MFHSLARRRRPAEHLLPADRRTVREAKTPRRGPQPLRARIGSQPDAGCVLVVVIGMPAENLETAVAGLAPATASVPVFLTDDDRFEIFVRHRAIFEYLPPVEPAPHLDVDLYRLRRLALLRRKWQPSKIIALGAEAARLVQLWRASPLEDRRIEEITGGPPARTASAKRDGK